MVDGIVPKLIGGAQKKPDLKNPNSENPANIRIDFKPQDAANAAGQSVAKGASTGTAAVGITGSVSGEISGIEMGVKGLTIEHKSTDYENGVATGTTTYQYGEQKTNEDDPVSQFKKLDKDGDLKVSAQEYTDNIVEEYVKNGHQLPSGYDNIAEFINAKYTEFLQYAGEDASMNIDEFRNMLIGRLTSINNASKSETSSTPPDDSSYTSEEVPPLTPPDEPLAPEDTTTPKQPNNTPAPEKTISEKGELKNLKE